MKQVFITLIFLGLSVLGFSNTQEEQDSITNGVEATDVNKSAVPETTELTSDVFKNVVVKGKSEKIEVTWSIDYDLLDQLAGKQLIIKYNSKIGAKRMKKQEEKYKGTNSDWKYTEPIDLHDTKYTLAGLNGNEKYEIYIGLPIEGNVVKASHNKEKMVWSSKVGTKTERSWGIMKLLILIGSLGLFIFGMKVMSDGLQRTSGERLRKMLGSITSNRVKGVLTGFGTTAIVQSSSVTTVMTVSMVNAGLLNLRQSAGVMMGANIGTTITAWLVLMLGFKVSISSYALVMIAFGAPLLFMTFSKSKDIANTIIGFAILFIGLQFLKDAVPDLGKDSAVVQFFTNYSDIPFFSNLMFVGLGALVTIVIQSSSAAMALTLTMVSKGIIPFEVACAMILGENIGTTITAELASMIGNVHAKRSARIHSLFNIIGVGWMLIVMPFFLTMIGWLTAGTLFDPKNTEMANSGIALFHTFFNLANVVLLIGFLPKLVTWAEKTVKSKGDADEEFKLDYITGGIVDVPEVAILEARKEVAKFGKITSRMSEFTRVLLNNPDKKIRTKMFIKLKKYEDITDRVEIEVAEYLEKISRGGMTSEASSQVRSMLSITSDLERIGDIFYQMSKSIERKDENKIFLLPEQRRRLNKILDLVDVAFEEMNVNLNAEYGHINIIKAKELESEINRYARELRKKHLDNVENGDYNIKGGMVYRDLFSASERIGDHIINVSEAVCGEN